MTLVFLTTEFPPGPGGIGTQAWQLACHLSQLGISVKVLCPADYVDVKAVKEFDAAQNFETTRWPYSSFAPYKIFLRILFTLLKIKEWKASYLLSSGSRATIYAWVGAKLLRLQYTAIGHGAEFTSFRGFLKWLIRTAFNQADQVVCVSHFTRKMAEQCGIRPEKIRIIYNGADAKIFFPDHRVQSLKSTLGLHEHKVILTIGNVSERKAQDVVIQAMPAILKRFPDAVYLIAGWPTQKNEYESLAKMLGVDHCVKFVGTVAASDLPKYYNLCDVFVLNSRIAKDGENEGFGIVLVEAGLCGKPVVGTRGCGIEEVIVHRETGLLISPDSPEQTAEAIIDLLQDPEKAMQQGMRGRERALAMFTWERCGKEFYDLIMSHSA